MNKQQLEAQSDADRQDIEETIGAIKQRLTPGQLLDEVLAQTKNGGGEFLSNLGRQATANPLPVTLIGAGLAWFLFSKDGVGRGPNGDAARFGAHRATIEPEHDGSTHRSSSVSAGVRNGVSRASEMAEDGKDALLGGIDRASETISAASEGVSSRFSQGAAAINESAKAARGSVAAITANSGNFIKEQPVLLVGVGIALGAAIGASFPASEVERNLMSDASQDLQKQAGDIATDHAQKLKAAGEHIYQEVTRTVKDEVHNIADPVHHNDDDGSDSSNLAN